MYVRCRSKRGLATLKQLANGTRPRLRNIMSAIFAHAMRWGILRPTPDKALEGIYRTMVFVGGVVGLRVSEVIGLRWSDCDFESGDHLSRGIVRQHETEMKTDAGRKPVPLEQGFAEVLQAGVQSVHTTSQTTTSLLQSRCTAKPIWPNSAMEDHVRPAAKRAGITKRIGWHTLRHRFGTPLKANGEDVATVQALMRHANVSVPMNMYVQTVTPAKRKAQRGIIKQIREVAPDGPDSNLKCLQVLEMVGAIGFEPMTSTV